MFGCGRFSRQSWTLSSFSLSSTRGFPDTSRCRYAARSSRLRDTLSPLSLSSFLSGSFPGGRLKLSCSSPRSVFLSSLSLSSSLVFGIRGVRVPGHRCLLLSLELSLSRLPFFLRCCLALGLPFSVHLLRMEVFVHLGAAVDEQEEEKKEKKEIRSLSLCLPGVSLLHVLEKKERSRQRARKRENECYMQKDQNKRRMLCSANVIFRVG